MSLFVFAFLGNSFYVASILTNPTMNEPPPISTDYITESIPSVLSSRRILAGHRPYLNQLLTR